MTPILLALTWFAVVTVASFVALWSWAVREDRKATWAQTWGIRP